tara:strand:- start:334 stop:771 length:438 start_codon:yes stop_codon:yes gene_type:complete
MYGLMSAVMMSLVACGGATVVNAPAPTVEEAPTDPLGDFRGDRVKLNEWFELRANPKGLEEAGIIVTLVGVQWTEIEGRNGKTRREGTATVLVEKGDESSRVFLGQDERRKRFGHWLEIRNVGETYEEKKGLWFSFVEIVVRSGE